MKNQLVYVALNWFMLLWLMELNENKEIINFKSLIIILRMYFCPQKNSF